MEADILDLQKLRELSEFMKWRLPLVIVWLVASCSPGKPVCSGTERVFCDDHHCHYAPNSGYRNAGGGNLYDYCPSKLPRVQPIAPVRRKEPFDDPGWLFDFKYDGFRGHACQEVFCDHIPPVLRFKRAHASAVLH